jgi:hypothetical protein
MQTGIGGDCGVDVVARHTNNNVGGLFKTKQLLCAEVHIDRKIGVLFYRTIAFRPPSSLPDRNPLVRIVVYGSSKSRARRRQSIHERHRSTRTTYRNAGTSSEHRNFKKLAVGDSPVLRGRAVDKLQIFN